MKQGGILFVIVLAAALLFFVTPYNAEAAVFNCTIRATSCNANETALVYLNSSEAGAAPNNSHAQLVNSSDPAYPYVVCCWSDGSPHVVNSTCSGTSTTVLKLFNHTDSHVEAGTLSNYSYKACLNVTSGNITCEYPTGSCSAGYSPVLSMASSEAADVNMSNAHIGDYALYNRKVCCQIGGQNPPVVAYANISPNGSATTRQDLECQNGSVTDADGDAVTLHYNWILNGTSATVLNLPMDYDGTKTHDISGYGNDGTVNGATFLPTSGKIGGGFGYDGVASYINGAIAVTDGQSMTVAAWIKPQGNYNQNTILHPANSLFQLDSGSASFWVNVSASQCTSGAITYSGGTWMHLAVTFLTVNNTCIFYKDGSVVSGTTAATTIPAGATYEVGRYGGSRYFNGSIDEVMVFNRSLTPSEIQTLYATNNRWFNHTELRRGNQWNCSITPVDSTGLNGSTKFSNKTNITGSPPLAPNLTYPLNNNLTVFERYLNFTWNASDEPDGDIVNYTLVANVTPGVCGAQVNINTTTTNYTYGELCVEQLYNWTVRACDPDGCSNWSSQFNFTIPSVVSITLNNNNTNFGTLNLGQSKDTQTGGVTPFVLENNGNVFVNVTILGNNSPFVNANLSTTAFQYKARANESGAFPTGTAQMAYTPITNVSTNLVKQLNYTDVSDDVLIDINITVPAYEPPGNKNANITFSANRWNNS